jgi:hypothetical protein
VSPPSDPPRRAPPESRPPTLGSAFPPPPDDDGVYVTIVDSAGDRARKLVPVTIFDENFVWVDDEGNERRFNRQSGFENPPGGSWSTWRLSGHDHRRWVVQPG